MKITYTPNDDGRSVYTVESGSGNTYRVSYCGSGDGDPEYCATWECDCPAGRHGRMCKHIQAVAVVSNDEPIEAGAVLREA